MSRDISDEKLLEYLQIVNAVGEKKTLEIYGIKEDTLRRYIDLADSRGINLSVGGAQIWRKLQENFTEKELKAIANGGRLVPGQHRVPIIDFEKGTWYRFGYLSDTHLGSNFTNVDYIYQAFETFEKAGVEMILHAGDVTEGHSNRQGHVFELSHIGYDAQKSHAIEVFSQSPVKVYMISGNHDAWFYKQNGALIVQDICEAIGSDKAEYLGHDQATLSIGGHPVMLWHGLDGDTYALSYRVQKIIESFSGGEKPVILLCGHTHKYVKVFVRNVHAISCACIQSQSDWMRGKRRASHVGFGIVDVMMNKKGVGRIRDEFLPFYA